MTNSQPFCSTIIPTIGRETLSRAVESVLNQSLPNSDFEIIVVNDSGQPLPPADWQQSSQVRIINTNKRERSIARNTGAAVANGRYLHFLDDDDWLTPDALKHLQTLSQQTNAVWLYGSSQLIDRQGQPLIQLHHNLQGNVFVQTMAGEWLPLQSSLIDSKTFFAVGGFNPQVSGPEDVDLCRRISLVGDVAGVQEVVAYIGMGEENSTTDYEQHSERSRRIRESIFSQRGVFARLRQGATNNYWRGRVVRAYLTSVVWNLQHKRPLTAVSRLLHTLYSTLLFLPATLSTDYWQAITRPYQSFAFTQGFQNAHSNTVAPNGSQPLVSLGMPVYNGENFLESTLDSLLAQTFTDFELIITDNASTDSTQEICERYAAQDKRIRYIRNSSNLGAARNYNLTFELASGEYFKWVAHDDPLAPTCLEECVQLLDNQPDAIMCYPKTILIDENDELIEYHEDNYNLLSPHAHQRLNTYFHETSAWCHPVFGLMRSSILANTSLIGNYASSDKTLLAEISLWGKCYEVSNFLAYRRLHPQNSTEANRSDEAMAAWFDPHARRSFLTPRWRRFIEHLKSIHRAKLTVGEKLKCYRVVLQFYFSPDRLKGVVKDINQVGKTIKKLVFRT